MSNAASKVRSGWINSAQSISEGINIIEPWDQILVSENLINLSIAAMQKLRNEDGCPAELKKILKILTREGEWGTEHHEAYSLMCALCGVASFQ